MSYSSEQHLPAFNIKRHVEYAMMNMTNTVDYEQQFLPFFLFDLLSDPPKLQHSEWDFGSSTGRMVTSFILGRAMTGTDVGLEVEEKLKENLISYFGNDGLSYRKEGPFSRHEAFMHDQRAVIMGLTAWLAESRDPGIENKLKKLCRALYEIAAEHKYYPSPAYRPNGWLPVTSAERTGWCSSPQEHEPVKMPVPPVTSGRQIYQLMKYYELTGDEVAWLLAENFAHHSAFEDDTIGPDGSFNYRHQYIHFHSVSGTMVGLLEFGWVSRDWKYIERAKRMYDWAKRHGSSFGWFPESLRDEEVSETCCIVDMLEASILLAKIGFTEYWNDAERYLRNHLVEAQLVDTSWIKESTRARTPEAVFDNIPKRAFGAFAGWSLPNDFISRKYHNWDIMNCCTYHAINGLYHAWRDAIVTTGSTTHINLLIDRHTKVINVRSWLPYQGGLEIDLHKDTVLYVRLPEGVSPKDIRCHIDGYDTSPTVLGNYLRLGRLCSGQHCLIEFPLAIRQETERVYGNDYIVKWKGNTVVGISPVGTVVPLYQRERFMKDSQPTEVVNPEPLESTIF